MKEILILQTSVPDYRRAFFSNLRALDSRILVASGDRFFASDAKSSAVGQPWDFRVRNSFMIGGNLLWQTGLMRRAFAASVVVAEWNPRILSTWVILLGRNLLGRKTLLWGHARSQRRSAKLHQGIRDAMASASDGVIAYTESEATIIQERNPGLPTWSAPNSGVLAAEMNEFELKLVPRTDVIYVGRLVKEKKPMLLLEAWRGIYRDLMPGSRLVFVGSGPELAALKHYAKASQLDEQVIFLGHISDLKVLNDLYSTAVVSASPGYVGLSAIQSMSFGVPMIVSRDEIHSPEIEACLDGVTCRYFATNSVWDLGEQIRLFYRDSSQWAARAAEIKSRTLGSYSIEMMAAGFYGAVAGLIPESRPNIRVAVVWDSFGPYHRARLAALAHYFPTHGIIGLAMATKSDTYLWNAETIPYPIKIQTLTSGNPSESVDALSIYRRAFRFFTRGNIGVVFVPSYWPLKSLAIYLAAKRAGASVIMMNESHAHTSRATGLQIIVKRALVRGFDAALVGGRPHKEYFESLGLDPKRIFLGYNAVDNMFFKAQAEYVRAAAAEFRRKYALPARFFLSVSRMEPKKNLSVLVDAYLKARAILGNDLPSLVFVGSGSLQESLRDQCLKGDLIVLELPLAPNCTSVGSADVVFAGFRQIDELSIFYALADVFILPSREEEWGLVVNEAMACGTPVIVSNVAGCRQDLVIDAYNGFSFSPTDPTELAEHLIWIARNREEALIMGQRSAELVEKWGCDRFALGAISAIQAALAEDAV